MQGLKKNSKQFWLLVLINAFVGSMVGLERSVLPTFGNQVFHIEGKTILLSFIIAFGSSKAISNLLVSKLSRHLTRKNILLAGWLAALPVPFLLMYAPSWNWIIAANILLGINQGLAWSSTVIMKIDLVGEKDRGFAMGINEFAGYLSVGLAAYLAGSIAAHYGYVFYPFLPGVFFSFAGLLLTIFFVKDTSHFIHAESMQTKIPFAKNIWKATTIGHRNLSSVTLNGLVNNLNDGIVWGLLPVFLLQKGYSITQIGLLAGIYPVVWGIGQLFTGKLGDVYCKKQLITAGMMLQAIGLLLLIILPGFIAATAAMSLLGIGTALVYPNFLSVIAENTHPRQRAESLSIFRFWRDSGYVLGALLSGLLADSIGIGSTFIFIALLTAAAGMVAQTRMCCTNRIFWSSKMCATPC